MALDDLLAKLERDAGTAGTPAVPAAVPLEPAPLLGRTAGTAGTAKNAKVEVFSSETPPTGTAPPIGADRWPLYFTDRDSAEVLFLPPVDRDEALGPYADTVEAEPVPERGITAAASTGTKQMAITRRGCSICRHLKRPGLSAGYCSGGRDDLPGAYGPNHPLRRLPDDQGVNCASYAPHED